MANHALVLSSLDSLFSSKPLKASLATNGITMLTGEVILLDHHARGTLKIVREFLQHVVNIKVHFIQWNSWLSFAYTFLHKIGRAHV